MMDKDKTPEQIATRRCIEEKCGIRNHQCDQCRRIVEIVTKERDRIQELEAELKDFKEYLEASYKDTKFFQSKAKELEAEIERLNRQRNMEQGAWEQTDAYKEDNANLKIKLAKAEAKLRKIKCTVPMCGEYGMDYECFNHRITE